MATKRCYNCNGSGTVAIDRTNSSAVTTIACPTGGGAVNLDAGSPPPPSPGRARACFGGTRPPPPVGRSQSSFGVYLFLFAFIFAWAAGFDALILGYEETRYRPILIATAIAAVPIFMSSTLTRVLIIATLSAVVYLLIGTGLIQNDISIPFSEYLIFLLPLATGVIWERERRRRGR